MSNLSVNEQVIKNLQTIMGDKSKSRKIKQDFDLQTTDWMTLLVAQLKNQDMYNQTDMSEMTGQMAQFSQIQAIQSMVSMQENIFAMNNTSYAASLIGKEVTVAELKTSVKTTEKGQETVNELITTKGTVTGMTLFEGQPYIYIGDKKFSLAQIMVVGKVPEKEAPQDSKPKKTEGAEGQNASTSENTGNSESAGSAEATTSGGEGGE